MANQTSVKGFDYAALEKTLRACKDDSELFCEITNAPFGQKVETALLFLGIIVLLLVNKETGTIDRIAITDNEFAKRTKQKSIKRFEEIKIPVGYDENIIAKAIKTGKPQGTADWQNMFNPVLTPVEARFNQADGGIAFSAVYPLFARDGGALIFSYFQYPQEIGSTQEAFMTQYSDIVSRTLGA